MATAGAARKRLSLSRKRRNDHEKENDDPLAVEGRFASPVKDEVMEKAKEGVVPSNTHSANQWAIKNFQSWMENRNSRTTTGEHVPSDLLESHDPKLVCKWLCYFIQETRREDGQPYPPRTLKQLLCGVRRVMVTNRVPFNIFDRSNLDFRDLHLVCDSVCSDLLKKGIGSTVKHAQVISFEHEDKFWELGLLGTDTPEVLQDTVFYYVGLHFVLRGGEEQHSLKRSQFVRFPQGDSYDESTYYEYAENGSKNRQGRFDQVQCDNKVVTAYAQPGNKRCIVKLLDMYLPKLPSGTDTFYLRPCQKIPEDPCKPWYVRQNVGINKIKEKLISMSAKADLPVRYTNHSLRATAITRMYGGRVPEKIISEKSGHKSLKALRSYERTTAEQDQEACQAITESSAPKKMKLEVNDENPEKKLAPFFTGQLSNCTFNFNYM